MVGAVCQAMRKSTTLLDSVTRTNAAKLAKDFAAQGLSPGYVADCGERWFTEWFPGKRSAEVSPATVAQLRTWVGQCVALDAERDAERAAQAADDAAALAWDPGPADKPYAAAALWRSVQADMALMMPPGTHSTWVAPCKATAFDGATLTILAPTDATRSWLTTRLRRELDDALATVAPGVVALVLAPDMARTAVDA